MTRYVSRRHTPRLERVEPVSRWVPIHYRDVATGAMFTTEDARCWARERGEQVPSSGRLGMDMLRRYARTLRRSTREAL